MNHAIHFFAFGCNQLLGAYRKDSVVVACENRFTTRGNSHRNFPSNFSRCKRHVD